VRDRTKTVDLKQLNAVPLQPHWRSNQKGEPGQPLLTTNQKAYVKNYGEVWFDNNTIINILCVKNVRKKFRVTYDSDDDSTFLSPTS